MRLKITPLESASDWSSKDRLWLPTSQEVFDTLAARMFYREYFEALDEIYASAKRRRTERKAQRQKRKASNT